MVSNFTFAKKDLFGMFQCVSGADPKIFEGDGGGANILIRKAVMPVGYPHTVRYPDSALQKAQHPPLHHHHHHLQYSPEYVVMLVEIFPLTSIYL